MNASARIGLSHSSRSNSSKAYLAAPATLSKSSLQSVINCPVLKQCPISWTKLLSMSLLSIRFRNSFGAFDESQDWSPLVQSLHTKMWWCIPVILQIPPKTDQGVPLQPSPTPSPQPGSQPPPPPTTTPTTTTTTTTTMTTSASTFHQHKGSLRRWLCT